METNNKDSVLRLMSYNIQVGIDSSKFRHYFTRSWKHFLPHSKIQDNLNRIALTVQHSDIVAIQEADAGSLRSHDINQMEFLAERGKFPYWYTQINRNLGHFAQHGHGLLSKLKPKKITEHKLPGLIPGRGVLVVQFGDAKDSLTVVLVHLALGKLARLQQLAFLRSLVNKFKHVVLMGDFNCQMKSMEMRYLCRNTTLSSSGLTDGTFPSWRPKRKLDHILTTPDIKINNIKVIKESVSDHLPIVVEIKLANHLING